MSAAVPGVVLLTEIRRASWLERHFSASRHSGREAGAALGAVGESCGCGGLGQGSSWGPRGAPLTALGVSAAHPSVTPLLVLPALCTLARDVGQPWGDSRPQTGRRGFRRRCHFR